MLGSAPFCAMGLAIGAWNKPQSPPAEAQLPLPVLAGFTMLFLPVAARGYRLNPPDNG